MNLGVGLLVMEMLGSLERSGLQIHLVFDEKVHSLTMVVGIVLSPWHGGLQMFLDQLNDPSSIFGRQVGHQIMMTTILSKYSMKTLFTGYIK